MSVLRDFQLPFPEKDSIFTVAGLAAKAKQTNNDVIDGTLGALYDDNGKLITYDSIFKIVRSLTNEQFASYAPITGGEEYKETIKEWILPNKNTIPSCEVNASMGGSGAIYLTLSQFFNENDDVILLSPYWGPYDLFVKSRKLNTVKTPFLVDEKFNIDSVRELLIKSAKEKKRVGLFINSPANNPTGYSLTNEEWKQLIQAVNEASKYGVVVLVNDIAYIDYSEDLSNSREYMNYFNELSENVILSICVSFSKSLSFYGLRLGALIYYTKNEDDLALLRKGITLETRATWSNPNHSAINSVNILAKDKEIFNKENRKYASLLLNRGKTFTKFAKQYNLPMYPYKEGFFITIPGCENNEDYCERLMKRNVFLVNQGDSVRIAICAIKENDMERLVKILKEELK